MVNSIGAPVADASVTFDFDVNGKKQSTLVQTTESAGWTPFAVADIEIPFGRGVCCNM